MGKKRGFSRFLLMTGLILASRSALAGQPAGALTYPASFFASAQSATAYDMVGRLPGFVFDSGPQRARFFRQPPAM